MTPKDLISIGTLAHKTGLSVECLRMWERRYGAPESIRLPSGHRRYPEQEIERLRYAALALEQGYRARQVAPATLGELKGMLRQCACLLEDSPHRPEIEARIERWIAATAKLDDRTLAHDFHHDWTQLGAARFLSERVVPLIYRLGQEWANGELTISQEHFASEQVSDFLAAQWRRMNERIEGANVLVASLPGDQHRLGLQMVSVVLTLAGKKVVYIGPQTPPREIVEIAKQCKATAVCLSISITMDLNQVTQALGQLRLDLPNAIRLAIGGKGAPPPREGIERMNDLADFYDWLKRLPSG